MQMLYLFRRFAQCLNRFMAVMCCSWILYNELFLLRILWHIIARCTGNSLRYYLFYGKEPSNGTSCPLYTVLTIRQFPFQMHWVYWFSFTLATKLLPGIEKFENYSQSLIIRSRGWVGGQSRSYANCCRCGSNRPRPEIDRPSAKTKTFVIRTWSKATVQFSKWLNVQESGHSTLRWLAAGTSIAG